MNKPTQKVLEALAAVFGHKATNFVIDKTSLGDTVTSNTWKDNIGEMGTKVAWCGVEYAVPVVLAAALIYGIEKYTE